MAFTWIMGYLVEIFGLFTLLSDITLAHLGVPQCYDRNSDSKSKSKEKD